MNYDNKKYFTTFFLNFVKNQNKMKQVFQYSD